MTTYQVVVTRESDQWLADVRALPGAHTHSRSLAGLRRSVREVITLMGDYPDSAVTDPAEFGVEFAFDLPGDLGAEVTRARQARDRLAEIESEAIEATSTAARDLAASNVSLRDAAEMLGVSFQRVQQLVAS
ncbi:MAG: type II toxin-antitoxin system HicB family antitoxin [Actinomycetota bacterium]|nr:type II toxin-antitoxin system HicB family antitoxin [Actinomycetota bacterium]MDP9100609.1 type II toxin-antitoxin system HicB family antitoxin [Actinomycetota bacterium]